MFLDMITLIVFLNIIRVQTLYKFWNIKKKESERKAQCAFLSHGVPPYFACSRLIVFLMCNPVLEVLVIHSQFLCRLLWICSPVIRFKLDDGLACLAIGLSAESYGRLLFIAHSGKPCRLFYYYYHYYCYVFMKYFTFCVIFLTWVGARVVPPNKLLKRVYWKLVGSSFRGGVERTGSVVMGGCSFFPQAGTHVTNQIDSGLNSACGPCYRIGLKGIWIHWIAAFILCSASINTEK